MAYGSTGSGADPANLLPVDLWTFAFTPAMVTVGPGQTLQAVGTGQFFYSTSISPPGTPLAVTICYSLASSLTPINPKQIHLPPFDTVISNSGTFGFLPIGYNQNLQTVTVSAIASPPAGNYLVGLCAQALDSFWSTTNQGVNTILVF